LRDEMEAHREHRSELHASFVDCHSCWAGVVENALLRRTRSS
jgi:hypothetical protein